MDIAVLIFIAFGFVVLVTVVIILIIRSLHGKTLTARAERLEKAGRNQEALFEYKLAQKKAPENPKVLWGLANAYMRAMNFKAGLDILKRLLIKNIVCDGMTRADIMAAVARAQFGMGTMTDAYMSAHQILQENSRSAMAHNIMGLLYGGQDVHDRAVYHLKAAAMLDPNDPSYRKNLCFACYAKKDMKAAMAIIKATNLDTSGNEDMNLIAGLADIHAGFYDTAVRYLENYAKLAGSSDSRFTAMVLLGFCYKKKGLVDSTIVNYEAAVNEARHMKDPQTRKMLLYGLGMAYTQKGEGDKAAAHWTQLKAIDENYKDTSELLLHFRDGFDKAKYAESLEQWKKTPDEMVEQLLEHNFLRSKRRFNVLQLEKELGTLFDYTAPPSFAPASAAGSSRTFKSDEELLAAFIKLPASKFRETAARIMPAVGFKINKEVSDPAAVDYLEGRGVDYRATSCIKGRPPEEYLVCIRRYPKPAGANSVREMIFAMEKQGLGKALLIFSSGLSEDGAKGVQNNGKISFIGTKGLVKILRKIR